MALHPPLDAMALKRNPLARDKRAPHMPSIVDGFSLLPWQGYVAGSVAPIICPLVLAAARASPAALGEDTQNDSRRAIIRGGLTSVGTAALSPRCGGPEQPLHVGRSNSRAQ